MQNTTIFLLGKIYQTFFNLEDNQIFFSNQSYTIPNNNKLFVVLEEVSTATLSNNRKYQEREDEQTQDIILEEFLSWQTRETFNINFCSKSHNGIDEARIKQTEFIPAIRSTFAKQTEEQHCFYIANSPNLQNISNVEGQSMMTRFLLTLTVFRTYNKTIALDYFNPPTYDIAVGL